MKLEIKNVAENEYSIFVYGDIVGQKDVDFWTGEPNESDIDVADFKKATEEISSGSKLNMYVNSAGGDVFATSTIVSILNRVKEKGVEINAYIDGVACSCASWLLMVANNINIYKNSVMMIHKPLVMSYGNADDLAKDIEVLNKIEDGVIIPMYETKAKCGKKKIKDMMQKETWLTANEISEYFNVNYIDEAKVVENVKSDLFNTYKNTPKSFSKVEENQPREIVNKEKIDYTYYKNILKQLEEIHK